MSRTRPDDRDRQPPKSPALGVPVVSWDEQPSAVHSEPWLFRALREIKTEVVGVREKQGEQGEAIAEIRGEVKTLASFVPRPKSPSSGVSQMLLADKLDESKVRRRWWLKVGGTLLAVGSVIAHWMLR